MGKRIIIDARLYGLENAGIGRYTINLIENLAKFDTKNNYSILLRKKYFNTLKLPNNFEKILFDVPHYSVKEQLYLPEALGKQKPDVFHALQINFPILYRGESMITIHDTTQLSLDRDATTLKSPLYSIKSLGVKIAFRVATKKCKKILVPTKQVKKDLIDQGVDKDKITVTYEGVGDVKVKKSSQILKKLRVKNRYFVYVGSTYPHKNVEKAVDAIKELNKDTSEQIDLIISSKKNKFTEKLERYSHDVGAGEFVKFAGFIPDEDLGYLLSKSAGFVFPSKKEGFGLPGLEAMKAGTIVLASDIPVLREVYKSHAVYFDPDNVKGLVKTMKGVLNDKNRIKKIKNAKEYCKNFSWMKMAKETMEIY